MLDFLNQIDTKLYFAMNGLAGNPVFDGFNILLSSRLLWIVVFLAFSIYAIIKGGKLGKKAVILTIVTVSFTDAFTFKALKENIERRRPCMEYKGQVTTPAGCYSQFGFPSNHAANSAAIAATVYLVGYKKLGVMFGFLALLVSLSRVFLGVHYPGDITVGMITGALYSYLIVKLFNMYIERNKRKKREPE
jgi:undecaprenyl-diphosphatase